MPVIATRGPAAGAMTSIIGRALLPLLFAWLAAAAFAGSLGFFLYAYLVLFGLPTPSGVHRAGLAVPIVWDLLLFTAFALHHSVFARTGIKQLVKRWTSPALERAVYSLAASVLFVMVCWWWQPVPGMAWQLDGGWRWLGYAVQLAGILVTFVGARALDVLDLAGVRQVMSVGVARPFKTALKTNGVYGLVRHPLYFGWTLLVFGAPDMTATRLVFAAISTLYLVVAIPFEERSLIETFGPDYASYQRKVRWRIIPGLH
jgi:protein-S-isoprenylcysteine O-methyltransferase Ste14